MLLLAAFSFLAGVVTILSPCIFPVLPIILTGAVTKGRRRPWGIVSGFVVSFAFFTLALATVVRSTGLSADALRLVSIVFLALFGLFLFIPRLQLLFENIANRFLPRQAGNQGQGYRSGFLVGVSLGLLWTPCVGPIMAAVISLAATSSVNLASVLITLAYSAGTAFPMLGIMYGGRGLLNRFAAVKTHAGAIQRGFGVLMVIMALALYLGLDRSFQYWLLSHFPNYGAGLTALEKNTQVEKALGTLTKRPTHPLSGNSAELSLDMYPSAPELIPGGQWFNSQPLTLQSLRGKVVLVDFWTYTCINCLRTLPYLKAWQESYADKGLVIIGVHTPEFEFEKNPDNVQRAVRDLGIKYPVVQDNAYATWQAYQNHYWPAKYFIDKDGRVRATHFGEGDYDASEGIIRRLLRETGSQPGAYVEKPAYSIDSQTPETYLGLARTAHFSSPEKLRSGWTQYTLPQQLDLNGYAYLGNWLANDEYSSPKSGAELAFRFSAKDVFLVLRPLGKGPVAVQVWLDGLPITVADAGKDVKSGIVEVSADRLYHLVRLNKAGEHTLLLKFPQDGVALFAFTFG